MLTRRAFFAVAAAVAARPTFARAAETLTLWGPPAAPSIPLALAVARGDFGPVAPSVAFRTWRTPDEMRAGIGSGTMAAVVMPSYVAANLYNRKLGVRLVNVLTRGLLYVVAAGDGIARVEDLEGKRLAVPFRNDMPDYVMRRLLAGAGLPPTGAVAIEYAATPVEAVQLLLVGRVDAALLAEPAASAALVRGIAAGRRLTRAIDCQKAWSKVTGSRTIPQAGLAVTDALAATLGADGLRAVQRGLEAAVRFVTSNPASAARATAPLLDVPPPVVERAIPASNLVAIPASAARADLTGLFAALAAEDPRIIGGVEPDDGFYAL